ncbi:hypothetical protein [Occallatibacter savannae]|uniref:hypothetical protein n=1 Tax=Occallatibacter savannae TaxID=1002691 RepID=UPI000D691131|nr:hypothetical protein [Occallatibacter savannae]
MNVQEFMQSLKGNSAPAGLGAPAAALWWDAKGDWSRAHGLVDELETKEGMAVHAYLHRKEGANGNAEYWYARGGRTYFRLAPEEEWKALVCGLLSEVSGVTEEKTRSR